MRFNPLTSPLSNLPAMAVEPGPGLAEPDLPLLDVIPGRLPSTGAASLALRVRF